MQYPEDCVTSRDRIEYLYAAQEKLRQLHNAFSAWAKDGLSQQQYDKLPAAIRSKYPYTAKLSWVDFRKFIAEDMETRSQKLFDGIALMREELKLSARWNIDAGEI